MIRSVIKVTAWERVSLARRLLRAVGRVLILLAVVAAIGYAALAHRYAIEAKVWHWSHGYTTTIGGYEVSVPDHWLILEQGPAFVSMANTSPNRRQRDGKFHSGTSISVDVNLTRLREHSPESNWADSWLALERQRLAREKLESVVQKTLEFPGESIACIGGNELNALMHDQRDQAPAPLADTLSLSCLSERGLNVMFVGDQDDVQSFYSFLSHIRRKS